VTADEEAIVAQTIAYCWAIDSRDFDALREVFLADGHANYGGVEHEGVDEVIAKCSAVLSPLDVSQHMVSTHQVSVDGDLASSRCYFHAQHVRRAAEGGPNYIVAGSYFDEWERTTAGWRIRRRVLNTIWTEGNMRVVRPA
jgi:hypothetical protein